AFPGRLLRSGAPHPKQGAKGWISKRQVPMACARDRLEDIMGRLEARKSDERVFTKLYAEAARAAADAADARRKAGVTLGPLDGAVVSIKDLFDVVGEPTLAGSFMRRHAAPATTDAAIVARPRRPRALILGTTALPRVG